MDKLDFFQAVHLVTMEPSENDALEFVRILEERGQITQDVKTELEVYVSQIWN